MTGLGQRSACVHSGVGVPPVKHKCQLPSPSAASFSTTWGEKEGGKGMDILPPHVLVRQIQCHIAIIFSPSGGGTHPRDTISKDRKEKKNKKCHKKTRPGLWRMGGMSGMGRARNLTFRRQIEATVWRSRRIQPRFGIEGGR